MLRPISQLNRSPIATMATPMPMIRNLVCACEAATPSAADVVLRPAEAMISSAAGSIWRVSAVTTASAREILPVLAIQLANASV